VHRSPAASCVSSRDSALDLVGAIRSCWSTRRPSFQVIVYYLLLLALVTSLARLRSFLHWTTVFCAGLARLPWCATTPILLPTTAPTAEQQPLEPSARVKAKQHGTVCRRQGAR